MSKLKSAAARISSHDVELSVQEGPIVMIGKHQSPARFIPDVTNQHSTEWTGRRKVKMLDRHTPCVWNWPTATGERQEAYDAWHFVAMQVLHKADATAGFRVMAIIPRFIDLRTGIVRGTNADFALAAGGCNSETISRGIKLCVKLCLFISKQSRRRNSDGAFISHRTLRLSVPQNIADISLDHVENAQSQSTHVVD